ncbi:MAG: hypothetical protein QNK20_07565 [Aureibaculum sp.]|nr:hypothetical protein [Aureibaculum sp.]
MFNKKMFVAANYLFYGSYPKAHDHTNIPESTLKQRVKYLKKDCPDQYKKLEKMGQKELRDEIIMYSNEDTR